jgi:hypothetical protein
MTKQTKPLWFYLAVTFALAPMFFYMAHEILQSYWPEFLYTGRCSFVWNESGPEACTLEQYKQGLILEKASPFTGAGAIILFFGWLIWASFCFIAAFLLGIFVGRIRPVRKT